MTAKGSASLAIRMQISRPAVEMIAAFRSLSPTTPCDVLPREAAMDHGIRPSGLGLPAWRGRPSRCAARAGTT